MVDAIFVPDIAGMFSLTRSPTDLVGVDLAKRGQRLARLARGQVGVKRGRLRSTIHSNLGVEATGLVVTVGSSSRLALMHHNGTRPHVIVMQAGNMLRFSNNGRIAYAREVRHPGTKPNRFLTDNLARVVLT